MMAWMLGVTQVHQGERGSMVPPKGGQLIILMKSLPMKPLLLQRSRNHSVNMGQSATRRTQHTESYLNTTGSV